MLTSFYDDGISIYSYLYNTHMPFCASSLHDMCHKEALDRAYAAGSATPTLHAYCYPQWDRDYCVRIFHSSLWLLFLLPIVLDRSPLCLAPCAAPRHLLHNWKSLIPGPSAVHHRQSPPAIAEFGSGCGCVIP